VKGNPYRTLGAEHDHRDFLESRGIVPEPKVKLSGDAGVLFDAALRLADGPARHRSLDSLR